MKIEPEILFQDDQIVVVNKPGGWLSIPDRFDASKLNLLDWLKKKMEHPRTVHRLDRETSGVIIFAKTEDAHRHLSRQFEQRETVKIYLALADGRITNDEGEIDAPIGEDMQHGGRMKITASGKSAFTRWRVIERFKRFTLCEAMILTGRMHQIRVHFKHMDHPLAVDFIYGQRPALFLSEIKGSKFKLSKLSDEEQPIMSHTTLHSYRLRVKHPISQEEMTFIAEPPKDFRALLNQLRRYDSLPV